MHCMSPTLQGTIFCCKPFADLVYGSAIEPYLLNRSKSEGTGGAEGQQGDPYRATRLWRDVIKEFRHGMPRGRRRVRMRYVSECFTGAEAEEWLLFHLQSTAKFGTICRQQVQKLLEKFVLNQVIEAVQVSQQQQQQQKAQGKERTATAVFSHQCLYRFVTEPGLLNFIDSSPTPRTPTNNKAHRHHHHYSKSPLKREREQDKDKDVLDTCFTNHLALDWEEESGCCSVSSKRPRSHPLGVRCPNVVQEEEERRPLLSWPSRQQRLSSAESRGHDHGHDGSSDGSGSLLTHSSHHHQKGVRRQLAQGGEEKEKIKEGEEESAKQQEREESDYEKEAVLSRLLRMVELPSLEGIVSSGSSSSRGGVSKLLLLKGKRSEELPEHVVQEVQSLSGLSIRDKRAQAVLSYLSSIHVPLIPSRLVPLYMAVLALYKRERERGLVALQLCGLLLPDPNQTLLQRMLAFAADSWDLREEALEALMSIVFDKGRAKGNWKEAGMLLVTMVENHSKIFCVPSKTWKQRRPGEEGGATHSSSTNSSFCQQVTRQQYLQQSEAVSLHAIKSLLEHIMADKKMPAKMKQQKLKQFQKQYPDIFAQQETMTFN